ncbi:MAG: acetyltransferase [Deltaproteobacteria bacterium]|nr:acetyltransferase [Deltaproteobacteria bacterium]
MKNEIILMGGGGHCKSCIDVIEQEKMFQIAGIVDLPENLHQKILGYEIIATDNDLPRLVKEYKYFLITLGQIKSPDKRRRLFQILKELGAIFPVIISPFAYVSKYAEIREGTIIMHQAMINVGARIGNNCIINNKVLIEHDAIIGDHCHIATGAVINGGVKIGSGTFFGSNAVCREYIEIGENSTIGLGIKITRNISTGTSIKTNR